MSQSSTRGFLAKQRVPEQALGFSSAWCNKEGPGGQWNQGVLCHRAQTRAFPLSENAG